MATYEDVLASVSQLAAVNGNLNGLIHSQLALVAVQREANEQARIANLIAVASNEAMDISRPWPSMPPEYESMRREIRAVLGIGGDDEPVGLSR